MFKSWLVFVVCLVFFTGLQAQNDCNCNQNVIVQVNAQCKYILRKVDLGIKNCPGTYISVQDNKAQNRDTIDAPGTYVYGLYQNDGRLLCQGNVIAMAPLGPVLDSVHYSQDTLSFQLLDQVFNKANTTGVPGSFYSLGANNIRLTYDGRFVDLVRDDVPNLGIPFFSMGCQTPCGITLSFSDELVYSACRDAQISNLYATIRRSWIARDCQGRIKSSVQFIHFKNPEKRDFVWNVSYSQGRALTLYAGECSLNPNDSLLKQVFPVTSEKRVAVPLSGLKISQAIQEQTDTTCGGAGKNIIRTYLIYDECRNLIIDTFKVILAPVSDNKQQPVVFSFPDLAPKIGSQFCIPLKVKGLKDIITVEFSVKFDPAALRFEAIKSNTGGPDLTHFGAILPEPRPYAGFTTSWLVPESKPLSFPDNSTFFEVCFTPLRLGETSIWIDSLRTHEVFFANQVNPASIPLKAAKIQVVDKNGFHQPLERLRDMPSKGGDKTPNVRVFPNPAQDQIYVALPDAWFPQGVILLKDLQGRVLLREKINATVTSLQTANSIPNGIHLLEIHSQNQVSTQRVLVLHP